MTPPGSSPLAGPTVESGDIAGQGWLSAASATPGGHYEVSGCRSTSGHLALASLCPSRSKRPRLGTWWLFVFPVTFAGSASSKHVRSVGGGSPRPVASSLVAVH